MSNSVMVNCTVYGNTASAGGGGGVNNENKYIVEDGIYESGTIQNCIIWNNAGGDLAGARGVTNSCFGGSSGDGNISADPMFVNDSGAMSSWDLRLKDGSPCVDAGSVANAPDYDYDGNLRPGSDGAACMGAYESPDAYAAGSIPEPQRLYVSKSGDNSDGLSWSTAFITIQGALTEAGA